MSKYETEASFSPSSEEETLQQLRDRQFGAVAADLVARLHAGEPMRVLSIARPDLLFGLGEELQPLLSSEGREEGADDYRATLFETQRRQAEEGDPGAISVLPKLATTLARAAFAVELLLDNRQEVTDWRTDRAYIQFIGSFNPQHIGHRTSIANTLDAEGDHASAVVQVVADHPIKKDTLPPYETRFVPGEKKLYTSTLTDVARVTQLDVPVGLGLAKQGAEQIKLIADVAGDIPRWQVGSDKFMTDVRNVQMGKALDKAGSRFENVHLYVVRRDTESAKEVQAGIDYVRDRFGAKVTLVADSHDSFILSASASKIRQLRAEGNAQLADRMEFSDLQVV